MVYQSSNQENAGYQSRLTDIEGLLHSDPARAAQQASEFLATVPGHPMALLLQGIACRLLGDAGTAIEILSPLSVAHPEAPLVHLQLGLALYETERNTDAVEALRRAVAANPEFGDAWLALAGILTSLGDTEGADAAFMEYLRCSVRDPFLQEASAALHANRVMEAESMLRGHLEQQPNDIAAMCLLADIADRLDRMNEAEELLSRCLELAPSYQRARHNYAVVLLRQNKAPEALQETSRLLAREPDNPEVRKLRAAILVRLREYDESIALCEGLLAEDPNQPTVWTSLGHMLKSVGRREDCIRAYRKAIELAPHYGEPYWSLVNLKTLTFTESELETMRGQLDSDTLSPGDRIHFNFALGRALEDLGNYADSFRYYDAGNRLRRAGKPYQAQQLTEFVHRCKELFSKAFFSERAAWGAAIPDPIFILGLPRSGSTLVEQILASHSAVEGTMELPEISAIAKSLDAWEAVPGDKQYPEILAYLDADTLRELGQAYIEQTRIQRKLGTPFFIDKMPNNFAHIGLIHLILPRARIIDVRRHPLACGFSLYKEHFARAQNFSYKLEDIGRYYLNYVELMAHFDQVLPGRVHRIIYESLVTDSEQEIRRLLEYCGLPFEANCLDFHKNERAVSTASSEQVRSPIYRSGLDHWRNYEEWLGSLKTVLGPLVDAYPDMPLANMTSSKG